MTSVVTSPVGQFSQFQVSLCELASREDMSLEDSLSKIFENCSNFFTQICRNDPNNLKDSQKITHIEGNREGSEGKEDKLGALTTKVQGILNELQTQCSSSDKFNILEARGNAIIGAIKAGQIDIVPALFDYTIPQKLRLDAASAALNRAELKTRIEEKSFYVDVARSFFREDEVVLAENEKLSEEVCDLIGLLESQIVTPPRGTLDDTVSQACGSPKPKRLFSKSPT